MAVFLAAGLSVNAGLAGPFETDQQPQKSFHVEADRLPQPYADTSGANSSQIVPRNGREPMVPKGFKVNLFAQNLEGPRRLLVLDQKTVLVSLQRRGEVIALTDENADGVADKQRTLATGLVQPYGLGLLPAGPHQGDLLIADARAIWRLPLAANALPVPYTAQGVFGAPRGHITRSLAIEPATGRLFVGVGSMGNIGVEPEVKASIQVFDADGRHQRTFASGLRNAIGIGFQPGTGKLWVTVQERDGMGDRLVPDYFTKVADGDFFGWPYAYTGGFAQPEFVGRTPKDMKPVKMPSVLFEAHSSAIDFAFVPASWPREWQGDAIVALRGSWNRANPTGYKLVRVPFENGKAVGTYQNFVTGFWVGGESPAQVWGRPSNLEFMPDGALLVADDPGGTIWRIVPQP